MEKQIQKLEEVRKIQCADGNWNANEYMRGLANGLILAQSILLEKDPIFMPFVRRDTED